MLNIKEILEIVKIHYPKAYEYCDFVDYIKVYCIDLQNWNYQIMLINNKIHINSHSQLKCVVENIMQLKQALDIEITFEDIKDWVESLKLDYVEVCNKMIKIQTLYCDIKYWDCGDITSYNNNTKNVINLIFKKLSMTEIYNQIKLKIENINKNRK